MHSQPLGLWEEPAPKTPDIGEVESGYRQQIELLEKTGVMGLQHAGIRALVLKAARAVDQINAADAASGKGALVKALNEVAAQLPAPREEAESTIDQLRALLNPTSSEADRCPYDNIPQDAQ